MENTQHGYLVLAVLPVAAWLLYNHIYSWRFNKFNNIPEYFPRSLLLGHLKILAAGFKRLGDSRRHAGM
jgi:hypothetical protein